MKNLLGYSAPAGAEAVYSIFWQAQVRVFRFFCAVIAAMVPLGWVFALLSPPEDGKWLYQLTTIPFFLIVIAIRRMYDTEPVFASREGIYLLRDKAWKTVSWSRVGEAKPLFGIGLSFFTPIGISLMSVEGEPRSVRFIARRKHLEILERLRSGSGK